MGRGQGCYLNVLQCTAQPPPPRIILPQTSAVLMWRSPVLDIGCIVEQMSRFKRKKKKNSGWTWPEIDGNRISAMLGFLRTGLEPCSFPLLYLHLTFNEHLLCAWLSGNFFQGQKDECPQNFCPQGIQSLTIIILRLIRSWLSQYLPSCSV